MRLSLARQTAVFLRGDCHHPILKGEYLLFKRVQK
jgi:hypothetical protein